MAEYTTTRSVWGNHADIMGFNLHDATTYEILGKVGLRIVFIDGEPVWEVVWRAPSSDKDRTIGGASFARTLENEK